MPHLAIIPSESMLIMAQRDPGFIGFTENLFASRMVRSSTTGMATLFIALAMVPYSPISGRVGSSIFVCSLLLLVVLEQQYCPLLFVFHLLFF